MSLSSSPSSAGSQQCEVIEEVEVQVMDMTGDVATHSNRVTPPLFLVPTVKSLTASHKADIEAMLHL